MNIYPLSITKFFSSEILDIIPLILNKWQIKEIENFKTVYFSDIFIIINADKILISIKPSKESNKCI